MFTTSLLFLWIVYYLFYGKSKDFNMSVTQFIIMIIISVIIGLFAGYIDVKYFKKNKNKNKEQ